ncbi:MAG: ribonucleoside triphosphate reductase, partial [Solobacterium sp.]|nr:ribonucleoside triphosphate reductase [Solobacterium sp.]
LPVQVVVLGVRVIRLGVRIGVRPEVALVGDQAVAAVLDATSSPAGHLSTLCNQMVNFLGIMQNEWAGAQAFSSFDTYLAPFVKADNLNQREVKQCVQSFIYGVNTPSRWGTQAPFSNVTLDWTVPNDLKNLPAIVGGKEMDFTYGDCQKEMDMINKAFIEIMIEGDANGRGFQYPIPTYSITRDFDWSETENNKLLFEMTAKYGTPYFSNYINSDMEPSDVRSMCCRLRLDLRELRKKSGGFFGSGESTGSVGVVTINIPRIAYLSADEADFYKRLDNLMDISARSLKTKRTVITKLLEQGLYPYTKRYLGTFENHFSTIGLIGMNEAGLNAKWLRADMTDERVQRFTRDVLNHMRERLSDYQEMYGDLYNLEATPAESTTYRFAKHDKEAYPDIITANMNGTPYYTNSSHLPVGYTEDVFSALDIQDDLQTLYTSGTVFHAFLGEKLPDWKAAAVLVRKIAENYKLPYYTISPTYSVCADHGYLSGEQYTCPICGRKTEVYSRITGYYRPVQNWNDGKAQEFKDRKVYNIGRSHLTHQGPKPAPVDLTEEAADPAIQEAVEELQNEILLFKTPTCPNCKAAGALLDKAGVQYRTLNADAEPELVKEYGIKQAPTLVVLKDGGFEKYRGVSDIKGWLMGR